MKNKKAALAIHWYVLIFFFFIGLGTFFYYWATTSVRTPTEFIGEFQFKLIKTFQEAEKSLFYIDQSAKYSAYQAVYELGQRGGYGDTNCGDYLGYSLWINFDDEKNLKGCYPEKENIKENFRLHFIDELDGYLYDYPLVYVTADNYDFVLEQNEKLTVKGIAKGAIKYEIGKEEIKAEKIETKPYIVPKSEEEALKKISLLYRPDIKEASLKFFVKEALIAAVIMQESKGNPYAVSSTGCAGVNQFCAATARDYLSIFGTVKTCSKKCSCSFKCTKEQVVEDCGCDITGGRFNPQKSIKAGAEYLSKLLRTFKNYPYKEEFAIASYNGGEGVVKNAIKKTGIKYPTWQQVQQQLTPDLITYFKTEREKKDKVNQIKDYVTKVMGYKEKFEEIDKSYEGISKSEEEQIKKSIEEAKEESGEKTHDCCICSGGGCGFDCSIKSIPSSQYCGFASTGQGKNCDMSYCAAPKETLGTYSVHPSFKINIDYDIGEYDGVIEKAKEVNRTCSEQGNFENCVNKKIIEFNEENKKEGEKLTWSSGCEPEELNFFYDFVENYKLCLDAEEEGICEFSLDGGPKQKQFIIKLFDNGEKIEISLIGEGLVSIIDTGGLFVTTKLGGTGKANKLPQEVVHIPIYFDKNGLATAQVTYGTGNLKTVDTDNSIILYKDTEDGKKFISFVDKPVAYPSFKGSKQIYKPIKNTFKFCVKSSKQFYIHDEKTKKTELRNVEYKFALKFMDKIAPPPVEGIEVKDKLKDENSVLVLWDKSEADDVKEYLIYYSENDFKDQEIINGEIKDLDGKEIDKIKISEKEKIEVEDIDLSKCGFDPINEPCKYKTDKDSLDFEITLSKNKLYYWKNKYIYVLDKLEDYSENNKIYNFVVVAKDYRGNMIDNKDEGQKFILESGKMPSGKSEDDLVPNFMNTIEEESSENGKITLSWDRVVNNLDRSIAYDIKNFNLYYLEKDASTIGKLDEFGKLADKGDFSKFNEQKISPEDVNCGPITKLKCEYTISSKIQSGKLYWFGVTALDEADNEYWQVFVKPFLIP